MISASNGAVFVAILGFLIQSGMLSWAIWSIRKIAKEEVGAVEATMMKALHEHNNDSQAHPNHHVGTEFRTLVTNLAGQLASIQAKLDAVSEELSRLRQAHDEAVRDGLCLYQHRENSGVMRAKRLSDPEEVDFTERRHAGRS